jgi:hypothetical protein
LIQIRPVLFYAVKKNKMMKKILMLCLVTVFILSYSDAQTIKEENEEQNKGGFKKENLFAGGNVAVGFGTGSFSFGLGPYIGYSFNKYIDVAVSLNYNYISQRDYYVEGDKLRNSVIGPGGFVRIYPVKFLFAHAQYEQNFLKAKYFPAPNSFYQLQEEKLSVGSLLVGPGFASGRDEDNKSFYYFSVLFDVAKNINSPYLDGSGRLNPIIRAGFNIALFQGDGGRSSNRQRERRRF